MKIIKEKIYSAQLKEMAEKMFGNLVKGVVDIQREIMALDGELHVDLAELLVNNGSKGENLWGINIYPEITGDDWLEFDSMINLKPQANNRTRGVENPEIRKKIKDIIIKFIIRS